MISQGEDKRGQACDSCHRWGQQTPHRQAPPPGSLLRKPNIIPEFAGEQEDMHMLPALNETD
jgi:hypothetical protein